MAERHHGGMRQIQPSYSNIQTSEHIYDEPHHDQAPIDNDDYMAMNNAPPINVYGDPPHRKSYDGVYPPPPLPPKGDARHLVNSPPGNSRIPLPVDDHRANIKISPSHPVRGGGGGNFSPPAEGNHTQVLLQQKDNEIYLLRMNVDDRANEINKLNRDIDLSHHQMKHLNTLLAEKKEKNLEYQEHISSMQAELAELREQAMSSVGSSVRGGAQAPHDNNSAAEQALQMQVEQLSRQMMDIRRQLEEARTYNGQLMAERGRSSSHGEHQDSQRLRRQSDQARMELETLQRQNWDLKSKVEMLELQVATYNEDFHSERSDRERAQAELLSLKEERDSLKQAITMLATEYGVRLDPHGLPLPP